MWILDGILPSISENIEGKEDLKTDFKVPDDISKCFDDLRKVISTMEIPQTLFSRTNVSMTDNIHKIEKQVSCNTPEVSKIQPKPVTPQPGQTLFLCPMDNCDFYTTREQEPDLRIKLLQIIWSKIMKWLWYDAGKV